MQENLSLKKTERGLEEMGAHTAFPQSHSYSVVPADPAVWKQDE